jgi:hypothetical protein
LTTESQNEGIFGRRRHAGSPRNRWENEVRKNIAKLLSTKIGVQRQDTGVIGEKTEKDMARKQVIRRRNNEEEEEE